MLLSAQKASKTQLKRDARVQAYRRTLDRVSMARMLSARTGQPLIDILADLDGPRGGHRTKRAVKALRDELCQAKIDQPPVITVNLRNVRDVAAALHPEPVTGKRDMQSIGLRWCKAAERASK